MSLPHAGVPGPAPVERAATTVPLGRLLHRRVPDRRLRAILATGAATELGGWLARAWRRR